MYSLTNMCYVCLEKKDNSLININSSLSVHKDIMHIIGYLPFNLGWLKTKRIILICEECCRRLRDTYQLLAMCLTNSALLQGYMDQLNITFTSITNTDNEAELRVVLDHKPEDINKIKCEIKSEDEEIYTVESVPIVEETEDVFVNVNESFVKEEDTWKRDEIDDKEKPLMDNNFTESSDNEMNSEIAVNSNNTHDTDTASDSSGFTSTQVLTTNKKEPNTAAKKSHKCLTCSKSFSKKSLLQRHTRIHTGEKPYKCATCEKCFIENSKLVCHMRTHSGEKPYQCTRCTKCFTTNGNLANHMRIHTGEKPYKCTTCNKCFRINSTLMHHMRTHTGEKPHECPVCKRCFTSNSNLLYHMRTYTDERPYKCTTCIKSFRTNVSLVRHVRTHTGEKPYECPSCKKCFTQRSNLVRHMRIHSGAKSNE